MKKLGIVVLIFMGLVLFTGCGCEKKEKNPNNPSKPVEENGIILEDKTKENVKYSGASIVYEDGVSTLVLTVTNTGSADKAIDMVRIKLYDASKNLVLETKGYVGATLQQNASKTVVSQITFDLRKVKDVEYEIIK